MDIYELIFDVKIKEMINVLQGGLFVFNLLRKGYKSHEWQIAL